MRNLPGVPAGVFPKLREPGRAVEQPSAVAPS